MTRYTKILLHSKNLIIGLILATMLLSPMGALTPTTDGLNSPNQALAQEITENSIYLPLLQQPRWINPIGIETHRLIDVGNTIYQRISDLDATYVRLNDRISWRELQPNLGDPINWGLLASFETELKALIVMGARPIVVLDDYPLWATTLPYNCAPIKPEYYDEYAAFVGEVVNRYKYMVRDWELGNEVDIDPLLLTRDEAQYGCWGDIDDEYYGGQAYGDMLKVVSPQIRAADPTARIWHAGLLLGVPLTTNPALGHPENFIRGVLATGAAPYFDVLPYHAHGLFYDALADPYIAPFSPWAPWGGGMRGKANFLRQIMQEYGVSKPMMVNEIGVGCQVPPAETCDPLPPLFFEYKADMAIRIAARVIDEGLIGMVWYQLESPAWRDVGLLDTTLEPEPAYTALQVFKDQTKETKPAGPVDYGEEIEAYQFIRKNNWRVHVLWTKTDNPLTISIPKDKFIRAIDRSGTELPKFDAYLDWEIQVGFSPIFIELKP
jgi:hypothetical protein